MRLTIPPRPTGEQIVGIEIDSFCAVPSLDAEGRWQWGLPYAPVPMNERNEPSMYASRPNVTVGFDDLSAAAVELGKDWPTIPANEMDAVIRLALARKVAELYVDAPARDAWVAAVVGGMQ